VSFTEVTINPYFRALQDNSYFPLLATMPSSEDIQLESGDKAPSNDHVSPSLSATTTIFNKGQPKIMVKDSMDAISELIAEIQATETVDIPMPNVGSSLPVTSPSTNSKSPIRFSLARQKHIGNPSTNYLPPLHKFFHVLLSMKAVSILPVHCDSKACPMTTTSQINDLHATSARIFFKASKQNGSLARDFHINSSLSFEELSTHKAIINWLTLQGY
jgi:hypothetical protein